MAMKARRFDYWGLLGTLGAWAAIATLAGYFGGRHWMADLLANARPLYAMFLLPLAALVAVRRHWIAAGLFAAAGALNVAELLPAWWPRAGSGDGELSILVLNVRNDNKQYEATRELIRREAPDFVLLMEVDARWMDALRPLTNDLPHRLMQPRNDNYGIALLSRHRFRKGEIRHPGEGWVPVVDALCDVKGRPLRILGMHSFPPWGREGTRMRNHLLHALAGMVFESDEPLLVAGDLNVSPWSRHYRALRLGAGIEDAARGRGALAGWPVRLPPFLRIRKDYVFTGAGVEATAARLLAPVGSDHLPLRADFNLVPP